MLRKKYSRLIGLLALLIIITGCNSQSEDQKTPDDGSEKRAGIVNLYTSRHYDTDRELYDRFEEETGITVNIVEGDGDELMERLDREGDATEADVFITVDVGNLSRLKERGLTQSIESQTIATNVPEKLRDVDNQWVGLTKRARVIVYAKDRIDPEELSTYEALTEPNWQDRVLIRSSENIYNQSLLASLIHINGEEAAKTWAEGIVNNMAREPQGGDTDQVKAVVAGEGDVAIVNTYYIGRLLNSENQEDVKVGEGVGVFFPNQDTTGTHVNISGAALVKHATNQENAIKFLEFLTGEAAQKVFAEGNNEYPVNPNAEISDTLKSWGEFKEQEIDLSIVGENNTRAIQIFNEVGWK
jgi:iron(III) transport system substrate-binding protein